MSKVMETLSTKLQGDVTLSKKDMALIVAVASLAGIVIGLLTASFTHGLTISCGNNNGNNNRNGLDDEDDVECEYVRD